LDKYRLELEEIRDLAESVRNVKSLEGADVSGPLTKLNELEGKLCGWLAKVDPGDKNSLRRFADQLVHGQADRKKLDDIMRDLYRVKHNLSHVTGIHHIKMSHKVVVTKNNGATRSQKPKKSSSIAGESNVTVPTQMGTNSKGSDRIPEI
jgi:hypothetical protein